jgi:PleD family two-component response regulator
MQPAQKLPNPPTQSCLIVEDSDFDSERMRRVLDRSPYAFDVRVATTLASARKSLRDRGAALILLDNSLPDGLGADFALELARDDRMAHIPVILISDWPSPFMWEKAASAGVRYVISKREFATRYVHAAMRPLQKRRASAQ